MSNKLKGLTFEANEPAFLRRLRGEATSGRDASRHERPVARPKRAKGDDDDDAPTYVLEDGNESLSKAEYEALIAGKDADQGPGVEDAEKEEASTQQSKHQLTVVGAVSKKRKAVKVVQASDGEEDADVKPKKAVKKPKKSKAVKLSFGDDEG
ncbi:uncharacterized protein BDZ99DRAFT_374688 [Mytilinidion resinicola]|uniref:DUF4604 domain-containing protein n=1 Tax=Mytilinidion resinicola TaxID=574789 RepID=A0A6A6Z880_9PEZI|nr:uncharacterized protein BDZ99DRAFT_374688 [Mytilinidion resinicola]KAF2817210.1 hypothetical protein BDZ99DRAFT_374688 [Mytilinidion resinicola]